MKDVVLVLDKEEYVNIENDIIQLFDQNNKNVKIIYTKYEDELIRKVRNWRYIGKILQHILYWLKSLKYAKKIDKINSDEIICINPIVGIFLGLLNKEGTKKIILCGFLFENKKNKMYYRIRKNITKKFMNGIDRVIVYSSKEVEYYKKIFKESSGKFKFVQYGIDYNKNELYNKKEIPKDYFFSGGGSNRDYATLIQAYQELDYKIPLCIATKTECISKIDTRGIIILTDVVLENFGDVMEKSKGLILALKDEEISAGHQVLLQALNENIPIIVNEIPAVKDYVTEEQVIFYETKNIKQLKEKIEYLNENYKILKEKYRNNKTFYCENYKFTNLLQRLLKI